MPETLEQLKAELEANKARAAELQASLAEAERIAKQQLVDNVRVACEEHGWNPADIGALLVGALQGGKRAGSGSRRAPPKHYTDPKTGNVYRGRGLPHWLRDRMTEEGLNPESVEDRAKFRNDVLVADAI